jgi:hypothetical protein
MRIRGMQAPHILTPNATGARLPDVVPKGCDLTGHSKDDPLHMAISACWVVSILLLETSTSRTCEGKETMQQT